MARTKSVSIDNRDKRYIEIDGALLHESPVVRMISSAEIQAGLATAAFNAAVAYQGLGKAGAALAFGLTAIGLVANHFMNVAGKKRYYGQAFGGDYRTLCIDRRPDPAIPVSPHDILGAKMVVQDVKPYVKYYIGAAALGGQMLANNLLTVANTGIPELGFLFYPLTGMLTAQIADTISVVDRFNRVMEGEWTIATPPEKNEQGDIAETPNMSPAFSDVVVRICPPATISAPA